MTTGDGRIITYTAFDKPTRITKGGNTVEFFYGPDRKRFKRVDYTVEKGTVTTIYAAGKAYERIENAQGVTAKHYIGDFAVLTQTINTGAVAVNYLHRDHLGSVENITNEAGIVTQRMSFDAWGKRREVNWQPMGEEAIATFNTDITTRGFTGHEQIDAVGLIHMNGRVYDAELGRFLSADPHIQALDNLQNFNRYSYVLNNPLSYTDPTGFFFSKLFKAIGKAFGKIFKAIGRAFKKLLRSPIFRAIIQIVGCSFGAPACALISGAITAAVGGSLTDVLKAAAFAFLQVKVWPAVGNFLGANGLGTSFIGKGLVHGVVGGALSVAQGGNFLQGFASNAIGAVAGLAADGLVTADGIVTQSEIIGHTLIVATAGCASAVVSGGKCANGAITASFANMYNRWVKDLGRIVNASRRYIPGFDRGYRALDRFMYRLNDGIRAGARYGYDKVIGLFRRCSFHGRTQVKTDKGYIAIRNINPKVHKVWARDEHTGEMKYQKVLDAYSNSYAETVYIRVRDLKTLKEQTIVSNKIHPFFVAKVAPALRMISNVSQVQGTNATGEWVEAIDLKVGHRLFNEDQSWSEVVQTRIEKEPLKAYNIHVASFHTFFVRGEVNDNSLSVWVHNACFEISAIAPDWAQKGAHVMVNGIELALRPGNGGTIVIQNVFARDAGTRAFMQAKSKMVSALANPANRQVLYDAVGRGVQFLQTNQHLPSAQGRMAELNFLRAALKKQGLP